MIHQFPKTKEEVRLDKLLYFLTKHCSGLENELKSHGITALREKWREIVNILTDQQLNTACKYVKLYDSPFITPQRLRFVAHGLIDPQLAYEQAKDRIYKHPAVYFAAYRAEIYRGVGTDEQNFTKFRRAYDFFCEKVFDGEILKMPNENADKSQSKYIIKKKAERTPEEIRRGDKALTEIYNILGKKRKYDGANI